MSASSRTNRFLGIRDILSWFIFLLGLSVVVSSWLSIKLSTAQQYREMLALEAANPGRISAEEWISSEMDALPKALGLLLIGIPSFIIITGTVAGFAGARRKLKCVPLILGLSWILFGGLLHLLVWNL